MKPFALLVLTISIAAFAIKGSGQTVEEIKTKYGNPVDSYSVSNGIWMHAEFGSDGQLCTAALYPKRISGNTRIFYPNLEEWELLKVLDQLVPPTSRGKDLGGLSLMVGVLTRSYDYENVMITFHARFSTRVHQVTPAKKKKNIPKENAKAQAGDQKPSNSEASTLSERQLEVPKNTEIVDIRWKNRKCEGK